jgi:hypothetical protein
MNNREATHQEVSSMLNFLRSSRPTFSLNDFVNQDVLQDLSFFYDQDFTCDSAIDFLLSFPSNDWLFIVNESGLINIDKLCIWARLSFRDALTK